MMIYGDKGLMDLSAKLAERTPAHDIMIERHETAWGEKYKMAKYTCQETGETLAHVEYVDQDTVEDAWAEAVNDLLIDRIQEKLNVPMPGVSLAKTPVTRLRTSLAKDLRRNDLDSLADAFSPSIRILLAA
ncbi:MULTISPECIES: hypothetical protein [Streptomyces]|uniref:hypothetical protein n=1 Tax=Streptomyces TaxID=1883 RepID=UPI00345BA801